MTSVECIWLRESELGEGVRYDPERDAIWWVDILGRHVMCLDLASGERREWLAPTTVGTTFGAPDGRVLTLLRHSIAELDLQTGIFAPVIEFGDEPKCNRFNDGLVDPEGRIWAGSMDFDCVKPSGRLYCLEKDGTTAVKDAGYVVTNGPAISADGKRLYVNETMAGKIFCFDRNPTTNALTNKRLFALIDPSDGLPDGICTDTDGGLWVAIVTGGKIRRYRADGTIDLEIAMPVPIITSVAFGGKEMQTLYVTSGRILLTDEQLAELPASGSLFKVDVDFQGVPSSVASLRI